jgi:hypothetical protein
MLSLSLSVTLNSFTHTLLRYETDGHTHIQRFQRLVSAVPVVLFPQSVASRFEIETNSYCSDHIPCYLLTQG